jgi:multidrug resistance protein, MATE family
MSLLIVFKDTWGYMFSREESVVKLVASILPLAAFYQLSDTTGSIGGGAIRGCGLQKWGSYINLIGYYVIGVPIGLLLTFHPFFNMGLFGIWVGLTVGLIFVSTAQLVVILHVDWEKMAENAKSRLFQYEQIVEEVVIEEEVA